MIDDNGDAVGHQKVEAGARGKMAQNDLFDFLPTTEAGGRSRNWPGSMKSLLRSSEECIEQLKARKEQMKPEEYDAALEKLLIELATLNQQIRAKQKP